MAAVSGVEITITLDSAEIEAALDRAIAGGADMRPPMGEIASEWLGLVHDRFDEERDPLGVPWAKRRDNADPDRKLLHLKGYLRNAVREDFGTDYAQVGVIATGGPAKYGRIHNEGGEIRPRNGKALSFGGRLVSRVVMPKRQFVGEGPAERRVAEDVLGDWLRGLFAGSAPA